MKAMLREGSHISDERLLMELEGELAAQEQAMVCSHLQDCWECRPRRSPADCSLIFELSFELFALGGSHDPQGLGTIKDKILC
jgi:hypothetical protein